MISCDSAEIQTVSEDDSAMIQKGIFHEGARILKFGTHIGYDKLYCVLKNQPHIAYQSLYLSVFLSFK